MDRYPFTSQQITILLELRTLFIYDNDNASDENANDDNGDKKKESCNPSLSSITKESSPSIQWIEENIGIVFQDCSNWIKHCQTTSSRSGDCEFFECMAILTGRKGSPSSELLTVYNATLTATKTNSKTNTNTQAKLTKNDDSGDGGYDSNTNENSNANVVELISSFYRLGLACHCIQHWGEEDLDLEHVKRCACVCQESNHEHGHHSSMIQSLQTFRVSGDGHEYEKVDHVSSDDFLDWANINFPQMECILSTFMHLWLFSSLGSDSNTKDEHEHEGGEDSDSDSESESEPSRLSVYALGNRTMFQFPSLQQMVLATSHVPDFHSLAQRKIVASVKAESDLFHAPDIFGAGGTIGHFAFGLALMDPKLCGKVS